MRHIPNIITILRIIATPALAMLLVSEEFAGALYLIVLMAGSDALDGFLAKHYGWQSRLGEFLDPLADKLMLVSAYALLALQGMLPTFLVGLVIARDVLLGSGYFYYRSFLNDRPDLLPSKSSKINTCMQLFLIFAVLMREIGIGFGALVDLLAIMVVITTLVSGAVYALLARDLFVRRGVSRIA